MELMIDIETLDTAQSAVIIAISAVQFSLPTGTSEGRVFDPITLYPSKEEQFDAGRTSSIATWEWWKDVIASNPRAKHEFENMVLRDENRNSLEYITKTLGKLVEYTSGSFWCKGVGFDFPILKSYFNSFNLDSPFEIDKRYRRLRDCRQLAGFYELLLGEPFKSEQSFTLVPHIPRDDCIMQAKEVIKLYTALKEKIMN